MERITIYLTKADVKTANDLAESEDVKVSKIFRQALKCYVEKLEGERQKLVMDEGIRTELGLIRQLLTQQGKAVVDGLHDQVEKLSKDLNVAFGQELDDHREEVRQILGVGKPGASARHEVSRPTMAAPPEPEPARDESYFHELIRPQ